MRNISILGSTGSIGTQALEVIKNNKNLNVIALSANKNIKLLETQVREFKPKVVCVYDEKNANDFKALVKDVDVEIVSGDKGLIYASTLEQEDILLTSIVGMKGIVPTIEAIKAKKDIALANKETLVSAGHIIMKLARENNVKIIPVDSEHSAIFQSLQGNNYDDVKNIILTASGGPFLNYTKEDLKNVSLEDALKHPNWSMGKKVTIDSSTLANKGLEVIEAYWLFGKSVDNINVVIHPQSIIHSMVEYNDGAIISQMGVPDMKIPISYAFTFPNRSKDISQSVDFFKLHEMTFYKPDLDRFPCLKYAFDALRLGGSFPLVFNIFNEIAVEKFLNGKISYLDISKLIKEGLDNHKKIDNPTIEEILNLKNDLFKEHSI